MALNDTLLQAYITVYDQASTRDRRAMKRDTTIAAIRGARDLSRYFSKKGKLPALRIPQAAKDVLVTILREGVEAARDAFYQDKIRETERDLDARSMDQGDNYRQQTYEYVWGGRRKWKRLQ
jgi:hypothetical protein